VGVVPIGLTRYHPGQCRTYRPDESRAVLDQIEPWRRQSRLELGCNFVYPSDEWYLVAGRGVPAARAYDGFPQVENGVGMVRQLLDEWRELKCTLRAGCIPKSGTIACGALIAPVLAGIVDECATLTGASIELVPVTNQFFGPVTTVSGLLTGQDVLSALRGRSLGEVVLLPGAMFTGLYGAGSAPPGTTLDDVHVSDIASQLGVPVQMAGTMTQALAALGLEAAGGWGVTAPRKSAF
jgi:NifB/MoaA-like Fe-S oxidoreductase